MGEKGRKELKTGETNAGIQENLSFKFPKEERLHHRSLVEGLFRFGKSFYEFPFRLTWRTLTKEELEKNFCNHTPDGIGVLQMMVTVPKKKRRRAVDRVAMRRRIKEAYRLHKALLLKELVDSEKFATVSVAFVYIHDKNLPYKVIEEKMVNIISRLQKVIKGKIETPENE